jgi:hypothetical protein
MNEMNAKALKPGTRTALRLALMVLATVIVVTGLIVGLTVRSAVKSIPGLFKRSAALKVQGYYTGEFEFKMLSVAYYLNEGSYLKAYTTFRRIRKEMETTRGLPKMPSQASPKEMLTFLLDRQDPNTGAFSDASYPFLSYISPTLNLVAEMDDLAKKTGQPLKLKYPIRFLDEIRTPRQLHAFLDSLLYIKEFWADMSGPGPYIAGTELAYFDVLESSGVYRFSDEWKDALRQWFYETQDPETGLWGVRIGSPRKWRQNPDMTSTFHIIHLVLDDRGNDQSQKYPLRYAGPMVRNLLKRLDKPVPTTPTKQHGWSLEQAQGARMVTKLWAHLPEIGKEQARAAMRSYLTVRYSQFFRPVDGGFALYTSSTRGDVDGVSTALSLLRATGSLPGTRERDLLWGKIIASAPQPMRKDIRGWEEAALPPPTDVNSLRIYKNALPAGDGYDDAGLLQIVYQGNPPVLDLMDLRQKTGGFLATTEQAYGNWASKESLRDRFLDLKREIKAIPVSRGGLDLARIAKDHPDVRRFCVVGYDIFQVPVVRVEFVRTGAR